MNSSRVGFAYLNWGHFLDHYFMLIFATVAALALTDAWGQAYGDLIPIATPGFIAFGVCALPAGWLADRWSREGMMCLFFFGIGLSSLATAFSQDAWQLGAGLLAIGVFAAIYHPVGLAMVVEGREKTGLPLAINGVFGNLGVACAALLTGFLIDLHGWRMAFALPGVLSFISGIGYLVYLRGREPKDQESAKAKKKGAPLSLSRGLLARVFSIILISTAIGGLIFQSTTFALPKLFDERLSDFAVSASSVGGFAFIVFSAAALAQLVVGSLLDRYSLRWIFVGVAMTQAIFLYLLINLEGMPALLVAILVMLAVFGQIPINDVLIGRIASGEWRSRVYALRYVVTFSVMASTVPLIGWLHSGWGFALLFLVLAIAAAAIFVAVLFLPTFRPQTT